jgi:hypothetical protein
MFDEYLRYLASTYKHVMEENKKQGSIVDYAIYQPTPRTPQEADLILTVTYQNMAALDGLQARVDPIAKKVFGSLAQGIGVISHDGVIRKRVRAHPCARTNDRLIASR